jgi:uncharacterized membrane protein YdjX (TVP38/TMEM64 family)
MSVATLASIGAPRRIATWIKLVLLAVAALTGWWVLSSFDFERYLTPATLAQWLNDAGPWAPLLLIGSMMFAVMLSPIPSLPLDLAAGAAFDPFCGALYAVTGAVMGSIICFLIARALGRETLSRLLKTNATFCQTCTDHQLMGAVFFARLIPILSFEAVSYGAGFTKISLRTFILATLFGMAPPTLAFTYLGSSIVSAQWLLMVAGAGMVLFFLAMPRILTKYRQAHLHAFSSVRCRHRFQWPPHGWRFRFRSAVLAAAGRFQRHNQARVFYRLAKSCSIFLSGARILPSNLPFLSTKEVLGR